MSSLLRRAFTRFLVLAALAALGCAHAPPPEPPTLAGRTRSVWFDRTSIGYGTSLGPAFLSRVDEGTWRGNLPCGGDGLPGEIKMIDQGLSVDQRRYPVTFTSEEVVVHEVFADLVLRRSDGGPVPSELVVPLTMVLDFTAFCPTSRPYAPVDARGVWLDVDGIGRVEAFAVPAGQAALYLRAASPHPLPVVLTAAR